MKRYIPAEIEPKWQKQWAENTANSATNAVANAKKFYVLAEFTYPSGDLHMGHWFTFGGADIYARMKRMQGYNVFFPNGFDAFGLPAENAAIKRNIHPQDWTMANIARMKEQFVTMGASFSFANEVISCLPEYYRWNQWIFLRMLEKGIAYRGKYVSNWCPNCQTVLANEGVEAGHCWRCSTEVVQKEVEQWFFKITDYADQLIWPENPTVDWPKSVRAAQNDWIGKKEGIVIKYQIEGSAEAVEVFTTRPDTNFGATFIALAPEHPLALKITTPDRFKEVESYIEAASKKSELERKEDKQKTGAFTGAFAINNLNGEQMPIWVSDFVLISFGTGALVGVPAHDKRDFELAKQFDLQIKRVVASSNGDQSPITDISQVQEEEGVMINSDFLNGLDIHQAHTKVMDYLEEKGFGKRTVQYHLRDWSISRQRYWGTPIPVIHCPKCGIVPLADTDLPIELPYDVDYMPKGKSPLATNEKWLKVKCPQCGGSAERDADTMDTFVDSSWYFFRYLDPKLDTAPFDGKAADQMMPVDIYFGGAEHTLGHTLYARFFTKFFKDLGLTALDEFASKRIGHGVVLGPDGSRMSKSKGNVVNPDQEVKKYGTDAVRVYLAFFMPYDAVGPWISERIWGPYRFLERVWNLADKVSKAEMNPEDLQMMHHTIKKVTDDITAIKFNTVVSALMEWLNYLIKKEIVSNSEYEAFLQLLAPVAPHITEELWHEIGQKGSIHSSVWPEWNQEYLQTDQLTITIQVNGKVRDNLMISSDMVELKNEIEKMALNSPKVAKFVDEKTIKKTVYIPGKILNIVV